MEFICCFEKLIWLLWKLNLPLQKENFMKFFSFVFVFTQLAFSQNDCKQRMRHHGHYTDLTWMKHKHPLHCPLNHESLEFFRVFHLSELGMDEVTHSMYPNTALDIFPILEHSD